MLAISIVFGVDSQMPLRFYDGQQSGFSPQVPACQSHLVDICARLHIDAQKLGLQQVQTCWPQDFKAWIESGGHSQLITTFPLPAEEFLPALIHFTQTAGNGFAKHMGFARVQEPRPETPVRLQWFRLLVYAADMPRYAAGFRAVSARLVTPPSFDNDPYFVYAW